MESSKKIYHQARKEERTALTRETHAKADTTKSPEEVRKFTDRLEKCTQEAEKVTQVCFSILICASSLPFLIFSLSV